MAAEPSSPSPFSLQLPPTGNVALIAGATGMVGMALAEALKSHGNPWTVYAFARRRPPLNPLNPTADTFFSLDALDSAATTAALAPLSTHVTHLFWVALADRKTEEVNIADNSSMLSNVLAALLSGPATRLRHVALQTGTKHYMGTNVDPVRGELVGAVEIPFREESPRVPGLNFYYALEDILTAAASPRRLTWTVHRSSIILGASCRSAFNHLLTLCTYALICRREGEPFAYPGKLYTWRNFCDASDAGLLAEQLLWAAEEAGSGRVVPGEAFNCANGDVFTWRSFWKVLAAEFGVAFVECESDGEGAAWVGRMLAKAPVWDAIVAENGLLPTRLEELTCFPAVSAVLSFSFQHVSSTNKSREFGFNKTVDTLKSISKAVTCEALVIFIDRASGSSLRRRASALSLGVRRSVPRR